MTGNAKIMETLTLGREAFLISAMSETRVYLDHISATPVLPEVMEAIQQSEEA